ncbi:SDR family oxidoreductase [Mesobacterium pallidum]|uniref:SDR family oxidoreductase n=1 Tax=Mesobacterium pallidum TaxID=2872037 RepID=UPI001EE3097D|nr:SDR family oxidoreductase [Mesobacterium pallidum]
MKTALILGGRSDIGLAAAHRFAAEGYAIQLAARNSATLEGDKADLELRHKIEVQLLDYDALDTAVLRGFVDALQPLPDVAICAVGTMETQADAEADPLLAELTIRSNFEGPAQTLGLLANAFASRGSGTLIGVSSVAGDRGRATNYIYGSAKAGFTAYLSGLRNRLAGQGVHVATILPGFVDTKMTEGMELPGKLTASPEEVAEAIWKAHEKRRNVVYVKPIWRVIMAIIRNIPEQVFKRMKI